LPFFQDLQGTVINVAVLLLSLTVHEFFHAWTAWKLGDDTAARAGRLTLNPIPHIDVLGTLILPLMNAPIGWAKPVPVNPARFDRKWTMGKGDILVSAAGPLSNLGLGLLMAVLYGLLLRFSPDLVTPGAAAHAILLRFMLVNSGLALFNLLPIPPLDGGHVAANLIPYRWRGAWDQYAHFAPYILVALVIFNSSLPLLSWVLGPPRHLILSAFNLVIRVLAG
jgi:Zn-dependent protease